MRWAQKVARERLCAVLQRRRAHTRSGWLRKPAAERACLRLRKRGPGRCRPGTPRLWLRQADTRRAVCVLLGTVNSGKSEPPEDGYQCKSRVVPTHGSQIPKL